MMIIINITALKRGDSEEPIPLRYAHSSQVLDPPVPIDWRIGDTAFDELTYAGGSKTAPLPDTPVIHQDGRDE